MHVDQLRQPAYWKTAYMYVDLRIVEINIAISSSEFNQRRVMKSEIYILQYAILRYMFYTAII